MDFNKDKIYTYPEFNVFSTTEKDKNDTLLGITTIVIATKVRFKGKDGKYYKRLVYHERSLMNVSYKSLMNAITNLIEEFNKTVYLTLYVADTNIGEVDKLQITEENRLLLKYLHENQNINLNELITK